MNFHTRPLSGDSDTRLMADFSSRFPASHMHFTDLPYRFSSWALDEPGNSRLWFDKWGELAAWSVIQSPFWTIDFSVDPAAVRDLLPQVLDWAWKRAGQLAGTPYERPCWFINVFADCTDTIRALEAAGFASQADVGEDSWSKLWMERPGDLPVGDFRIPAGFTIRPLTGMDEAVDYVDLHRAVFESKSMTVEWRLRTLRHLDYIPDLDLVVEAPDGRLLHRLAQAGQRWANRPD